MLSYPPLLLKGKKQAEKKKKKEKTLTSHFWAQSME